MPMLNKQSLLLRNRLEANKAFYVLLAIFAVGLFMLFKLVTKIAPLTLSHTVYYCQKAISSIIFTLPHALPPLLALILLSIFVIGLALLTFKLLRTFFFIRNIVKNKVTAPKKVEDIAQELGIAKIDIVKSEFYSSFCYGFFKPRICLSLKLAQSLNKKELKAVLIHENYHLKNKDPLKILLSEIAASMFFFVPILKDIHNHYTLSKEIAADQLAIQLEEVKYLRSALIKILVSPTPTFSGVASFGSSGDLEQRVNVLTNNHNIGVKISSVRLIMSFTVFILALVTLNLPVYAIEDSHETHSYFICPYGGECMLSCAKQGVMQEMPFSKDRIFTPANYSPNN